MTGGQASLFIIGLGVSAVFAFARWLLPAMPKPAAYAGIAVGVALIAIGALNRTDLWPWLVAVAVLAAWASWSVAQIRRPKAKRTSGDPTYLVFDDGLVDTTLLPQRLQENALDLIAPRPNDRPERRR
jgi:hypothetical protein